MQIFAKNFQQKFAFSGWTCCVSFEKIYDVWKIVNFVVVYLS